LTREDILKNSMEVMVFGIKLSGDSWDISTKLMVH